MFGCFRFSRYINVAIRVAHCANSLIQRDIPLVFAARSISEEFSETRYRDNGEPAQGATHGRDPRSPKEKEDKERGDEGIPHISARSRAAFSHLQ